MRPEYCCIRMASTNSRQHPFRYLCAVRIMDQHSAAGFAHKVVVVIVDDEVVDRDSVAIAMSKNLLDDYRRTGAGYDGVPDARPPAGTNPCRLRRTDGLR